MYFIKTDFEENENVVLTTLSRMIGLDVLLPSRGYKEYKVTLLMISILLLFFNRQEEVRLRELKSALTKLTPDIVV